MSKEVLNEFGLKVEDGKQGREDLVFSFNDENFLLEVKGIEKSASKSNVRQLNGHLTEYKNEHEVEVKGILLVNAWRKLPIEERETKEKPIFPDEIMTLVNLTGVVLMTTQQLFVAYCEYLEGKFNLDTFVKTSKSTSGVMIGFEDTFKYKLNSK